MNTTTLRKIASVALLALFGTALGCADLEVDNVNAPDRDRALATAGDVQSLISGSYHTWWHEVSGASLFEGNSSILLSTASFQHSSWPANQGAVFYSAFPRVPIANDPANEFYSNVAGAYEDAYALLSSVSSGLNSIENNDEIAEAMDEEQITRARAFARFMQGLGHASVALLYDQGFVVDETVDVESGDLEPVPYDQLMDAAMGYFDQAISIAEGSSFTIPQSWMSREVSSDQLARLAHSLKARYMTAVARTPSERDAVDWQAVLDEIDAGVDEFNMELTGMYDYDNWTTDVLGYWSLSAWQQVNYFVLGMADQSGSYQAWLDQPIGNRGPDPNGEAFLIQTPDERFPEGSTVQEQVDNPGAYFHVPDPDAEVADFGLSTNFQQPGRGTWRWSYYFDVRPRLNFGAGPWPEVTPAEMRLLEAEAHLRMGDAGEAADLINVSRTEYGLNATDASGTNSSCVPQLPNGDCGGLMEMLKWEKRLETQYRGLHGVPWYFEGRGWGDLYAGTPVHFPLPAEEADILELGVYTLGGCGQEGGASTSVYQWPGEQC